VNIYIELIIHITNVYIYISRRSDQIKKREKKKIIINEIRFDESLIIIIIAPDD
jgi:hypothetical protein